MGLLEKAQQLKESTDEKKEKTKGSESEGLLNKVKEKKRLQSEKKDIKTVNEPRDVITIDAKLVGPKPDGLLDRVWEKRKELSEKKKYIGIDSKGNKEIIEEKTGFGWKGLGTRRIVFDHNINEYVYELDEPVLNETEIEIKDELSRLFKMLADVNITSLEKDEKEKYLEETLEQIIIDNNIKFARKKKEEKDEKKLNPFKKLFSFKKKDETEKTLDKSASSEKKKKKKLIYQKN